MDKSNIPNNLLQKLTLSNENILKIMYDCRVTPQTKSPLAVSLYDETSPKTAPKMKFDFNKLNNYKSVVRYFLGQLHAVHAHQHYLSIGEGIIDFNGKKWTEDNRTVLALYYMAIGSGIIPPFSEIDGSSKTELSSIIYPTYPTDHPKFDIKRAKLPLKRLGYDIDEQTHVD